MPPRVRAALSASQLRTVLITTPLLSAESQAPDVTKAAAEAAAAAAKSETEADREAVAKQMHKLMTDLQNPSFQVRTPC